MNWRRWTFEMLDTGFFRDGQPFNAQEGGFTSVRGTFPPSMATLQGAVRYNLAVAAGWTPGRDDLWPGWLGDEEHPGEVAFRGPYLMADEQFLFATPQVLLVKPLTSGGSPFTKSTEPWSFVRLVPGKDPVTCDLEQVRLPMPTSDASGYKEPEKILLTRDGLSAVLQGGVPDDSQVKREVKLWGEEPRVGLKIERGTRRAQEGMLYNITHVRPEKGVRIVVLVGGLPADAQTVSTTLTPLGGEGRLAGLKVAEQAKTAGDILPPSPSLKASPDGKLRFTLTLITPGHFPDADWKNVLRRGPQGVPGKMVSACLGRVRQVGGWNLKSRTPRPLEPFLPAGSTWFYETGAADAPAAAALHGQCVGDKTFFGCGQVLVGRWEADA